MAVGGPPYDTLKKKLQSAIQSIQWTYIIFWQLCPQQRILIWGDGYYNGSIKTRKTVQSVELSTEEAALSRSEQLRELYDSLAAGDHLMRESQQATVRRPSAALSPEDLTESEWFYLMCVSFSFPPGVGLVGESYTKQRHLWLTGANKVDSKVFTRAILAKSAHIQTVLCIPLLDGVVELGTTEKVEEAIDLVQHVKLSFMVGNDNPTLLPPKPALSAHSSNTTLSPSQISATIKALDSMDEDVESEEEEEEFEEEEENGLVFVAETCLYSGFEEPCQDQATMDAVMEANELLQLDMSEDIRFRSPTDASNNLDSHFNLLATSHDDSCRADLNPKWSDNLEFNDPTSIQLQVSGELPVEDTHYSQTVSTILHNKLQQNQHPIIIHHTDTKSSFAKWKPNHNSHIPAKTTTPQRLLKYILFAVPSLHSTATNTYTTTLKMTSSSHDDNNRIHVLAERRRRKKLNERFETLRSIVPLVTKMDKASILGETIQYVKQLRKKITELEALEIQAPPEKRKRTRARGGTPIVVQVEVSIIERDALVEMECVYREGLLLDLMNKLSGYGMEIVTVQSCVDDGGLFTAEIRAKVKVKGNKGKKISIMQVKKAINQIISPS